MIRGSVRKWVRKDKTGKNRIGRATGNRWLPNKSNKLYYIHQIIPPYIKRHVFSPVFRKFRPLTLKIDKCESKFRHYYYSDLRYFDHGLEYSIILRKWVKRQNGKNRIGRATGNCWLCARTLFCKTYTRTTDAESY